jgi:hypothetical protein
MPKRHKPEKQKPAPKEEREEIKEEITAFKADEAPRIVSLDEERENGKPELGDVFGSDDAILYYDFEEPISMREYMNPEKEGIRFDYEQRIIPYYLFWGDNPMWVADRRSLRSWNGIKLRYYKRNIKSLPSKVKFYGMTRVEYAQVTQVIMCKRMAKDPSVVRTSVLMAFQQKVRNASWSTFFRQKYVNEMITSLNDELGNVDMKSLTKLMAYNCDEYNSTFVKGLVDVVKDLCALERLPEQLGNIVNSSAIANLEVVNNVTEVTNKVVNKITNKLNLGKVGLVNTEIEPTELIDAPEKEKRDTVSYEIIEDECVEPRIQRIAPMVPYLSPDNNGINILKWPTTTLEVVKKAMMNRHMASRKAFDTHQLDLFKMNLFKLFHEYQISPCPKDEDYEAWVKGLKWNKSKFKTYDEEYDGTTREYGFSISAFIKREKMLQKEPKFARMIQATGGASQMHFGPMVSMYKHWMTKELNEKQFPIRWSIGLDRAQLGKQMEECMEDIEDPVFITGDFSAFDSSQTADVLHTELDVMTYILPNHDAKIRELRKWTTKTYKAYSSVNGATIKFVCDAQRKSGAPNTTAGNTTVNTLFWGDVIQEVRKHCPSILKQIRILICGDDSLIIISKQVEQIFRTIVEGVVKKTSFKLKLSESVEDPVMAEFLSGFYVRMMNTKTKQSQYVHVAKLSRLLCFTPFSKYGVYPQVTESNYDSVVKEHNAHKHSILMALRDQVRYLPKLTRTLDLTIERFKLRRKKNGAVDQFTTKWLVTPPHFESCYETRIDIDHRYPNLDETYIASKFEFEKLWNSINVEQLPDSIKESLYTDGYFDPPFHEIQENKQKEDVRRLLDQL